MSETYSKKTHRKRKTKSKPTKHKPKVTKEFRDTENEIAAILQNTKLSVDSDEKDHEALAIAFFFGPELNDKTLKSKNESSVEESEQSETHGTPTISTFIQVENDEPIKRFPAAKIVFNDNMFFTPSSTINPYIPNTLTEEPVLKPTANLVRMVNRFYEEGEHEQITSGSSLRNQKSFFMDDELYATVCEHEFHPVFCVVKPDERSANIIPSRKLITLTLNELKFTEHPLQQEEHTLTNKLENLIRIHFDRIENKVIDDVQYELDSLRSVVNERLEAGTTSDLLDLERNLSKLKDLRSRLHQEETTSKDLLQNILNTWIKLKKLRKHQEFHWTSLNLKIKVNEVNVDEDTALWTKRFETELNEIYREELESYYRAKRLRKSESEKKLRKPRKPNIETIKSDLKKTLKQCSRQPGEPVIEIVQSKLSDFSRPLQNLKTYFMRIHFDGQLVGSTMCFRLEPDLSLSINEAFGIYIDRRIPKEVMIKLYEKRKMPSVPIKIANILVPLPSMDQRNSQDICFASHKVENVSGRLTIKFHSDEEIYSKEVLQTIFPPPMPRNGLAEDKLLSWMRNQLLGIPKASQKIEQASENELKDDQNGTCTFEETLLQFCSRKDIDNNPRFRQLTAIYRREMKTSEMPYFENDLEEQSEEKVIEIGNWMDPIDVHKHNGKKYLRNLYEFVRNHCEQLSQISGNCEQLIMGDSMSNLKEFFGSLGSMFGPRRPLNPERTAQAALKTYLDIQSFNIVVNVVRATGIPVRTSSPSNLDRRDSSNMSMFSSQTFKYSNVKPFVLATYMEQSGRTMTADGSSPTWNEQLILQISGNPAELKGDLKIAIFDEYVENHVNDVGSMEVFQRIRSNWLGEYRLPIGTILMRQRIEGVFELDSPKVLLGYNPPSLNEAITIENMPEIKERVNLWLYVSVEPSFEMPQVITKNLECSELKEVRHHIHECSVQVREIQPSRFIDPLVCTMNGKRMCLTRLLEPVPLPVDITDNLLESTCRYVSLLNVLKHFDPCMQFRGIWLNNQTLLDTGWGSQKDLGVLLANFLLTIGIRCWVVLGMSYPYGESAYVLYLDNGELALLDPTKGRKYSTKDVYCPMNKVFYIFSQDNIFCNIQNENRVSMMNFDITDSSCWFPMFNKNNPAPLGGVQKLNYSYTNSRSISDLRKNIERKIMKKISAWRPMQKTIWNRAFQSTMIKTLIDLEYESTYFSIPSSTNHAEKILAEFANYKIFGFTLNMSYTNLSAISERVKSTAIHMIGDKKVEFSVAVHIHDYPFNILSVWIFLVAATPI